MTANIYVWCGSQAKMLLEAALVAELRIRNAQEHDCRLALTPPVRSINMGRIKIAVRPVSRARENDDVRRYRDPTSLIANQEDVT